MDMAAHLLAGRGLGWRAAHGTHPLPPASFGTLPPASNPASSLRPWTP